VEGVGGSGDGELGRLPDFLGGHLPSNPVAQVLALLSEIFANFPASKESVIVCILLLLAHHLRDDLLLLIELRELDEVVYEAHQKSDVVMLGFEPEKRQSQLG